MVVNFLAKISLWFLLRFWSGCYYGLVVSCLFVVQFWLCEHTNIVKPKYGHRFPRFLRWDVGELLSTSQGLKLSETNKFEVIIYESLSFLSGYIVFPCCCCYVWLH